MLQLPFDKCRSPLNARAELVRELPIALDNSAGVVTLIVVCISRAVMV